jgi:tRNA-2-methylthio-N6-dimethylallyladenosine synthase
VSRSPSSVLQEIRGLVQPRGIARDITLLGQNVNSYRFAPLDFPALLQLLVRELPEETWLRFMTSHPKDMSDELIRIVGAEPALCRHIHLPVQHGSDRVLQSMGRGYSSAHYLRLVDKIRKTIPGVSLTTDILVGFPRESPEDHRRTLELMRSVEFEDAFTYRYNPREGTRAFLLGDDVPDPVKQDRLSEVIDLQRSISRRRRRLRLGSVTTALVEGVSRKDPGELLARTEWDDTVVFPGDRKSIGSFARVCLERIAGNTFRGRELQR